MKDGVVYHRNKLWVPPSLRTTVVESFHNLAQFFHPGIKKTASAIRKVYSWAGLIVDVTNYIKGCLECQRLRPGVESLQGLLTAHPMEAPFKRVHMDIYEFQKEGKSYSLLTMIDNFTKWAEVALLPNKYATTIASTFLSTWVCRFGCPESLITDSEATLTSAVMDYLCQLLGVKRLRTTVAHPDANAPIESFHRVLHKGLQRFNLQDPRSTMAVDELLQLILFGYRLSLHSSLGDTPAYLTFGCDPRPPAAHGLMTPRYGAANRINLLNTIREDIVHKAYLRELRLFTKGNEGRHPTVLKEGDLVLIPTSQN